MVRLAMHLLNGFDSNAGPGMGLWLFLSIGAVSLFAVFIPVVTWIDSRRKEREAFYKAEMMRRLAEASGEGARAVIDLLREEERVKARKVREAMKIAGIINLGVGLSLIIFLYALVGGGHGSPYLCGLIPGFIGLGMLTYALFLASPAQ